MGMRKLIFSVRWSDPPRHSQADGFNRKLACGMPTQNSKCFFGPLERSATSQPGRRVRSEAPEAELACGMRELRCKKTFLVRWSDPPRHSQANGLDRTLLQTIGHAY